MRAIRTRLVAVVVGAVMCASLVPAPAIAKSTPKLIVPASYLVTTGGHVLWKHNASKQRRVASTIKMLNALVLMDSDPDLGEVVTVPAKAGNTPGIGLVKGQRLTMRKLLQLMLVVSANDAAETIAIHVAGTEKKYVKRMNAKAKALGLTRTHAIDPHGLSKREKSTAHDLSVIAKALTSNPVLRKTVQMHSVLVPQGASSYRKHSTDWLLGRYKGIVGVKTGFTNPAGYCFVGKAVRGKVGLISVVLGSTNSRGRFTQTSKLLNWGFAGFKTKKLVSDSTTMASVAVSGGVEPTVTVHASRDATAVVWTRTPRIKKIVLPIPVAPIHKGDQLGTVQVSQDGTSLVSVPLLADKDIERVAAPVTSVVESSASQAPVGGARQSVWARLAGLTAHAWTVLVSGLRLGASATGVAS
jgi:serine-type D-Ala-D-Ala carboxypeptidase (penicillin-binding protein 5/6)